MQIKYLFTGLATIGLMSFMPIGTSTNSVGLNNASQGQLSKNTKKGESLANAARDLIESDEKKQQKKEPEITYTRNDIKYYKDINVYQAVQHFIVKDKKIHFDLLNKTVQQQLETGLSDYLICTNMVDSEVRTILKAKEPLARLMGEKVVALSPYQQQQMGQMRINCYAHFYPKKPQII